MSRPAPLLTEGAVGKTLLVFSLPILGANDLQSLNGSVNSIWVGRFLGSVALTATSNANTVMFFLVSMMFGIGMAGSILGGQAMGAGDLARAKRVVGTSASFSFLLSIAIVLLGFVFSPQLLRMMRTPAEAFPFAVSYLGIVFVAMPFIFSYAFVALMRRGAGEARTPLLFSVLCVGLDIALNPLFIFGVGPLARLGIGGAAASTLIANVVALVAHLYRKGHPLCLRAAELGYLRIDRVQVGALVKKGITMGLQMIVMPSSAIVMFALERLRHRHRGGLRRGAPGLYIQMPAFAVGMAASAMAAQNVGAGRWSAGAASGWWRRRASPSTS